MNARQLRICIISPGQLGSNPRVVKEATAFSEEGHRVTVICTKVLPKIEHNDLSILNEAKFTVRRINFTTPAHRFLSRFVSEIARVTFKLIGVGSSFGCHWTVFSLWLTALTVKADLYVAHYTAALPAAKFAAYIHGGRYAFDAEDFHLGDLPSTRDYDGMRRLIGQVESNSLKGCCYVTAASPLIARAYQSAYQIDLPTVVLNVFPILSESIGPTKMGSIQPGPSIYWFSQTIGEGRGIETAIKAVSIAKSQPMLYLRGSISEAYKQALFDLAAQFGCADRLIILPSVLPCDLEKEGAAFDLGFIGESDVIQNRGIALTNKLFSYLCSGLAIVASDIEAHRNLVTIFGDAMILYKSENPESLAISIDTFLLDEKRLQRGRHFAWKLYQERFNWGIERSVLIDILKRVLI